METTPKDCLEEVVDPIYKVSAYHNPVYIYEEKLVKQRYKTSLSPQSLVKLIMKQIKDSLKVERANIRLENEKKREEL